MNSQQTHAADDPNWWVQTTCGFSEAAIDSITQGGSRLVLNTIILGVQSDNSYGTKCSDQTVVA